MYRVGLTGNIASGKSEVAAVWADLGAALVDADALAREAVAPGSPGLERVVAAFGEGLRTAAGTLDRDTLRRRVFSDPEARRRLETIVHPEVERLRQAAEERLERAGVTLVVHVIPLLFEVGGADRFDLIVLVDAPPDVRRERLIRHRHLTEAEATAMITAQQPAGDKRGRAHLIIENRGTRRELREAARRTWEEIVRRAATSG